jgi:hypothetical protein
VTLNPIEVTGIFFFGSLVLAFSYLSKSKFIKSAFKKYWKIFVVLILANIALKIPYKSTFFDGLEYEDSYIYKASARAFHEGEYQFSAINPYYPTSCVYGSLKDCRMSGIFVTNFLGYPYIINLGYRLFGYQKDIANIVSLLFSGISIAFLFIAAFLIIDRLLFALICCFVYITIPIFNVYASTSLTEPLSNAYLILVLLLYLTFINPDIEEKRVQLQNILGLSAIAFSLIFSILVKTTNMSLIFCLPIAGLISLMADKEIKDRNQRKRFLISLPVVCFVFLFSSQVLKFQTGIEINRGDIGVSPFSLSYFKTLAPVFVASFFDLRWYLVYTLFFLAGIFFGLKKRIGILPIVVFSFYFVLYTLHYRSYYFIRGLPVMKDEALRYMTSIVSVFSIIVGLGVYYLWQSIRKTEPNRPARLLGKSLIASLLIAVLAVSMFFTLKCRAYYVEDEYNVRVAPVKKTLEYLGWKDDILITSEHILFQIYGNVDLRLIDFCSIDILIPKEEIDSLIRSASVYYLETIARDSLDEERYRPQLQYLDSKRKEHVYAGQNFSIYRLLPE